MLIEYDVCLAVADTAPGASVHLRPCDDQSVSQQFEWLGRWTASSTGRTRRVAAGVVRWRRRGRRRTRRRPRSLASGPDAAGLRRNRPCLDGVGSSPRINRGEYLFAPTVVIRSARIRLLWRRGRPLWPRRSAAQTRHDPALPCLPASCGQSRCPRRSFRV